MTSPILNTTARSLVEGAYRATGITPARQAVKPYEVQRGLDVLNLIIKHWQAQGIHLWSKTEAIIPLNVGQRLYKLGPDGDEIAEEQSFFFTNTEADQLTGDTLISVFDVSGMTVPSSILSFSPTDSTQDWTAINSATLGSDGTRLTITNGAAIAGGAEYTLATTIGQEYIIQFDYEVGTSSSATFSAVSGTTLDSITLSANTTGELRFTANSDSVVFRAENVSTIDGQDTVILNLLYFDIATGSRIGIQLDSDIRTWSHVISTDNTVDPPTVRISEGLPSDSANESIVYTYDIPIDRPLRILQTRYADFITGSEIPTEQWSREEYFDQPDKDTSGTVVQWYYSPQLNNGELYVWQVASSVNNVLRFTYTRPLDISTDLIDDADIPAEWANPLKWNLAKELAIERKIPDGRYVRIAEKAAETLDLALDYDTEQSYIVFQPDYSGQ
ncbi:MAG: hypothetical protein V3V23_00185 [Dehalococcoidales bacterium]